MVSILVRLIMPDLSPYWLIKNFDRVKCKIGTDTGTNLFTGVSYYSALPALRHCKEKERMVAKELKWRNEK